MTAKNDNEKKHEWLTSLITGWGVKESWAKVIAGALIGALVACGFLSSCTWSFSAVTPTQNYESSVHILPVEEWKK